MPHFVESMRAVVRTSGRSPALWWRGLALRVVERTCAIAPFFVGAVWLDNALTAGAEPLPLAPLVLALLLLLLVQLLCSRYGQLACFLGAYDLMIGYRERVIDHVGRLPLGFLQRRRVGQIAALVTEDVKRVEDIFTHIGADLAAAALVPVLFLAGLAAIDGRLALALVATLPLALIALNAASRFFLVRGRAKQELLQDTAGQVVEFIGGLKTLRLFDQTAPWLARLDRRFAEINRASLGVEAWGGGSIQLYRMCLEAGLVVLLLTAAGLAGAGQLSPLAWLLFGLVAFKLLEPLLEAAAFLTELRSMTLGVGRVVALLAEPPLPEGSAVLAGANAVAFDRVGFRYEESWVLRDVSFLAARGTMTAIVGPSGAGKSTLLHLLARFSDPEEGAVTIDGTDVRALGSDQLYRRIGCVFQTVQLFDGTILDNLRIGRPDASEAEVLAACRAAYCDVFIDRLPDGLNTRIGENGQLLSGGERQRLSIARALLRDAPVLLLDEATASVDPEAQYEIQQALSRLAADRTVIVVAHRLHTIRHADQILVLDQGRVVERGDHDALLGQGGLYATLWAEQAG